MVVLTVLTMFSRWVIDSERRSMARAERADAPGAIIGTLSGSDAAATASDPLADGFAIDAASRADARSAFELARDQRFGPRDASSMPARVSSAASRRR